MILKYRKTGNPDQVILLVDDIAGVEHEMWVYHDDMMDYMDGKSADKCFPYLIAEERDLIVTGYTPEQWREFLNNPKNKNTYEECSTTI